MLGTTAMIVGGPRATTTVIPKSRLPLAGAKAGGVSGLLTIEPHGWITRLTIGGFWRGAATVRP